ncbi:PIN domain nuclease [Glycomyces sp. NPDC046736]|uniref:PIN domain nuclease n=1 Tax=Glycomyces sp. NPDC046736 TaxID=3155615 RepID=UPI0033EB28F5
MAVAKFLVDKSAYWRIQQPLVASRLGPLLDQGLLGLCRIVEMEMLVSARNSVESDYIRGTFVGHERLTMPDEVWDRASEVQNALVGKGLHRKVGIPDLLIAATAERHGVTVLHYDKDFDRIAEVTGQAVEWVVPPGEADLPPQCTETGPELLLRARFSTPHPSVGTTSAVRRSSPSGGSLSPCPEH